MAVAPPRLGLAKGDRCIAKQVVRLVAFVRGDPDAGRDGHWDVVEALDPEGLPQRVEEPLGEKLRPSRK
jgi:hypothetical protein